MRSDAALAIEAVAGVQHKILAATVAPSAAMEQQQQKLFSDVFLLCCGLLQHEAQSTDTDKSCSRIVSASESTLVPLHSLLKLLFDIHVKLFATNRTLDGAVLVLQLVTEMFRIFISRFVHPRKSNGGNNICIYSYTI